jgi:hypothetical protein
VLIQFFEALNRGRHPQIPAFVNLSKEHRVQNLAAFDSPPAHGMTLRQT